MDIQTFISKYRQAFGETAELPLLFYYDNEPVADTEKINGCFFKGMDAARKGEGLSLSAETIGCGGGKLYTAFAPMPEHVPGFVSQKERYKASPEDVIECIERLDIRPAAKKYLNFIRIDRVESFEPMEGILFFATPDMLSGLATWAFFDNNADDAVSCIFGSGWFRLLISCSPSRKRKQNRRPSYVYRSARPFRAPLCRKQCAEFCSTLPCALM